MRCKVDWIDVTLVLIGAWLGVLALTTFAGCSPKPQPPPTVMAADAGACPVPATPVAADVCDGLFTAGGYVCVRCPNVAGCVDRNLAIYCASPSCATDPACKLEPEDSPLQGKRPHL